MFQVLLSHVLNHDGWKLKPSQIVKKMQKYPFTKEMQGAGNKVKESGNPDRDGLGKPDPVVGITIESPES